MRIFRAVMSLITFSLLGNENLTASMFLLTPRYSTHNLALAFFLLQVTTRKPHGEATDFIFCPVSIASDSFSVHYFALPAFFAAATILYRNPWVWRRVSTGGLSSGAHSKSLRQCLLLFIICLTISQASAEIPPIIFSSTLCSERLISL